ncbi:MAG: hypothetical protein NTV51_02570 [Verrucomicrobia bacterium]|nr:hypothetical protein [Verrucomicrobiota bacterium]
MNTPPSPLGSLTANGRSLSAPPSALSLIVMDHKGARLYRSVNRGTVAQLIRPVVADQVHGHSHHDWQAKEFVRGPVSGVRAFFAAIVKVLPATGDLLFFGTGKGSGSEVEQFIAWQQTHHPQLSARIIGAVAVDQHHTTEAQWLAAARDFSPRPPAFTAVTLPAA